MTGSTFSDVDSLVDWLTEALAVRLDCETDDVRTDLPFGEIGLDSVSAAGLLADLEDEVGRRLDMSVLWDYPTIELLAEHLYKQDRSAPGPGG